MLHLSSPLFRMDLSDAGVSFSERVKVKSLHELSTLPSTIARHKVGPDMRLVFCSAQ